jgi:hypothetical protein
VTYTKKIALHDRITVDGVDVSNAFRSFGFTSETPPSTCPVSARAVLTRRCPGRGRRASQATFTSPRRSRRCCGRSIKNRTSVGVSWQPDGLLDNTRTTYHGLCQLRTFSPADTRGDASTFTATFTISDSNGIGTS